MADYNNKSGAGERFKRYARVTTTMSGLAARLASERYLGMQIDRSKHAADLRDALGGLKGPIMKVAQILSTIPDALPPEYADELASLQADAPAMGWLLVQGNAFRVDDTTYFGLSSSLTAHSRIAGGASTSPRATAGQ